MLAKLAAFWTVFRRGEELANAQGWKNRTIVFNFLLALAGLLPVLGYAVEIRQSDLEALAGGVVALVGIVNSVMHLVTSSRVGLPPKREPDPPPQPVDNGPAGG